MFNEDWYSDEQCVNVSNLAKSVEILEGNIIEIGCWEGKSTYNIANSIYPEILLCNDTWLGNVEESKCTGIKHLTEVILENRDVYGIFVNNMNTLTKGNYKIIKKDCIEWLKTYNEPIKFCHIDASHEYESVYQTIQLVLPKLVKNGVICGDDFLNANIERHDLHGGVERAVREAIPNFKNTGNLWYYFKE